MFTRQHYKAIAEIIKGHVDHSDATNWADYDIIHDIGKSLEAYFAEDNPKFDRKRFLKACGLIK